MEAVPRLCDLLQYEDQQVCDVYFFLVCSLPLSLLVGLDTSRDLLQSELQVATDLLFLFFFLLSYWV